MAPGSCPVCHSLQVLTEIAQRYVQHVKLEALYPRLIHLAKSDIAAKRGFDREADTPLDVVDYELLEFPVDGGARFERNALVRSTVELGAAVVGIEIGNPSVPT